MEYDIRNNALIAADIEQVERLLVALAYETPRSIAPAVAGLVLGGKRLRPAILLISGHLGKYDPQRMTAAAAALEVIHVAALIHDDIIDRGDLRRGVATLNSRFGQEVAVFAGDYLFTQAFSMIADSLPPELLPRFSRAVNSLCRGEILQFESRYDMGISTGRYLDIIRGKTASLFELAASLGGELGGLPEDLTSRLEDYGLHLGLAFQITDDILDLSGDTSRTGKDIMKDVAQGIYTLPIIYALEHPEVGPELRRLLAEVASDPRGKISAPGELRRMVNEARGRERAIQTAREEATRASSCLDGLPDTPYRELLRQIASSIIDRNS